MIKIYVKTTEAIGKMKCYECDTFKYCNVEISKYDI